MGSMTSTNLLALSSGVQGASSLAQGYVQGQADTAQGRFEQRMSEINASRAELAAADAVRRGDKDAATVKKAGKQVRGAQRARMAAQGIDVDSGSAMALQEETEVLSSQDAERVKNNAWREAWGFKQQASDYRADGRMKRISGRQKAATSYLTGGMQAVAYGVKGYGEYRKGQGY